MKRWIFVLTTLFILLGASNCYAVEIDGQELCESKLIINFYSKDSEYVKTPVEGIVIEILYDDYEGMVNIRDLPEMKNLPINLVSDINGNIVVNHLPYGLYEYRIVGIPDGYEADTSTKEFILDLLNSTVTLEEVVTKKVIMAENTVQGPDEEVEIEEPSQIPEEKPQEEVQVTEKKEVPMDVLKVNDITEIIYKVDNDMITDEIEEEQIEPLKEAVEQTKMTLYKSKADVIAEYKEYKMNEAMKDAIVDMDNPIESHFKMISDLLDDGDDEKKKKKLNIEIEREDLDMDKPKETELEIE